MLPYLNDGGISIHAQRVRVSTGAEQHLHHFHVAVFGSQMYRAIAVHVLDFNIRAVLDLGLNLFYRTTGSIRENKGVGGERV